VISDDSFKLDDYFVFTGANATCKTKITVNKLSGYVHKATFCHIPHPLNSFLRKRHCAVSILKVLAFQTLS